MDVSDQQDRAPEVSADVGALLATAAWLGSLTPAAGADRAGLVELIAAAQSLSNSAAALQDAALARLAARETDWAEDGTLVETVRPLGHLSIDAADLAAPALGATHGQAQRRMEQAVRVAAACEPVVDGLREVPQPSGLGGLHAAMREGRLDTFRAGVVADELAGAPAAVAEAVVAALEPQLHRDASTLRKRARVLLGRISPDLLRARAEQARSRTGLVRWVSEPGVDTWRGTFPSEDAATAWAAIDTAARRLVADGVCATLEQARGKALTDLVTGQASVTVSLVLTTPADTTDTDLTAAETGDADPSTAERSDADASTAETQGAAAPVADPAACRGGDFVEVRGVRPTEPALVARAWVDQLLSAVPGAGGRTARRARKRAGPPTSPGGQPDQRVESGFEVRVSTAPCHRDTGALQPDPDAPEVLGYRPPEWMLALVRARDGRCRFPGCSVAARFCDLDHLRPWPNGPTAPDNLACLCRRHHRIKQRPGWTVRALPGAVLQWTDPTGRVTTTEPQDALHGTVLPAGDPEPRPDGDPDPDPDPDPDRDGDPPVIPTSDPLEIGDTGLDVRLEHALARQPGATVWTRPCARGRGISVLHARLAPPPKATTATGRRSRLLDHRPPNPVRWPDKPPF